MLSGKTIVISGVGSDLGQRTAALARDLGAEVVGIGRAEPDTTLGTFVAGDLGTADGVEAVVNALPSRIDALCSVANPAGSAGSARGLTLNFFGIRALSQAVGPRLRDGGAIVSLAAASPHGHRAHPDRARRVARMTGFPDTASIVTAFGIPDDAADRVTAEVLMVWTALAARQPQFKTRGIRVNAVSPGPAAVPGLPDLRPVLGDVRADRTIVAGDAGVPDIARVALFLCSDGARWVNGASIAADAGRAVTARVPDAPGPWQSVPPFPIPGISLPSRRAGAGR